MAQEKGKRTATSGILSYSKPLKESLENESSGSEIFCMLEMSSLYYCGSATSLVNTNNGLMKII